MDERDGASPKAKQPDEEDPTCTICLCEFEEGEDMTTLPCLHLFHKECLEQWLREKGTCPMCNIGVEELLRRQQEAEQRLLQEAGLQEAGLPD